MSSSFSPDSSGCYSLCSRTVKYRILMGFFFVKTEDLCLSQVAVPCGNRYKQIFLLKSLNQNHAYVRFMIKKISKEAAKERHGQKGKNRVLKILHATEHTKPSLVTALVYKLVCHIKNKPDHLFLTRT